jgi:hypothetical protein
VGPGSSVPRRRRYRSNSLAMASPLASGSSAVSWASSRLSTYSATSVSEAASSLMPRSQARASSSRSPCSMGPSRSSSRRPTSAAHDAGGALVAAHLEAVPVAGVLAVGGGGDRDGARVRDVGHERAQGDDGGDLDRLGELHQLDGEGPPAERRLDALHQHDVAAERGVARDQDAGGAPADAALAALGDHARAVDLEVVVVLGVERGDDLGPPDLGQVLDHGTGGLAGVVPALEGSDHHRVAQGADVLELDHARPPPPGSEHHPTGR